MLRPVTSSNSSTPYWDRSQCDRHFLSRHLLNNSSLKVISPEDCYSLRNKEIERTTGDLLRRYGYSLHSMFENVYPEHQWIVWKFGRSKMGFWKKKQNRKSFFDWAASQLGITVWSDWYSITLKPLQELGGSGLLRRVYNNSLLAALQDVYPECKWQPHQFQRTTSGYWDSVESQRVFFDSELLEELKVTQWSDWFSHSFENVLQRGGRTILGYYNNSLAQTLEVLYPEYPWLRWEFDHGGFGMWNDHSQQRQFIEWLAQELDIKCQAEWKNVSIEEVARLGGQGFLSHFGNSLSRALQATLPEYSWSPHDTSNSGILLNQDQRPHLQGSHLKTQHQLLRMVKRVFRQNSTVT